MSGKSIIDIMAARSSPLPQELEYVIEQIKEIADTHER